jgi:long-chain acyl-CoA synthetase
VKIAPDGEVMLGGPHVFLGYHEDPAATAEALRDGWLLTGDVGELTPDGELRITGRKKDLFITAGGKNVAPAHIESLLKASSYLTDAVLVGDGRRYLTAPPRHRRGHGRRVGPGEARPLHHLRRPRRQPEVVKLVAAEVEAVNKTLSQVETVKRFAILPKRLYQEDGEVTPTLKVKRQAVLAQYANLVEAL